MLKQCYDLLAHHYTSETLVFEPPTLLSNVLEFDILDQMSTYTPKKLFLRFKQLSLIFIKSDVTSSLLGGSLLFVFLKCDLNFVRSKL